MAFEALGIIVFVARPCTVALFVITMVLDWLCPISSSIYQRVTASNAQDTTCLIVVDSISMALLCVIGLSLVKK